MHLSQNAFNPLKRVTNARIFLAFRYDSRGKKMKLFKLTVISFTALTLAACGGSGGEDPVEDVDFSISDGVLANFEVPTDTQIAEFPNEIANTVNAFIEANENEILTPTLPAGEALFVGPWAMGQTDEGDALVGGTMSLDVDFDAGDEFLSGRLDVDHAFDDDGNLLTITSNPLDFWDVDINLSLIHI